MPIYWILLVLSTQGPWPGVIEAGTFDTKEACLADIKLWPQEQIEFRCIPGPVK